MRSAIVWTSKTGDRRIDLVNRADDGARQRAGSPDVRAT